METKSIFFELKDINLGKREIVFAHAVYDNVDNYGDISRKGMFTKSWNENKSKIGFYVNHEENKSPGKTIDFWEDDQRAYTKASFNNDKNGNDALEMVDNKIISSASFGYNTLRREYKSVMGRKIRELKEVKHNESTLLTYDRSPANPLAGIVSYTKDSDIKNIICELKEKIIQMEAFCRNTKASDDCVLSILNDIDELKSIFSKYESFTYAAPKAPTPELEFAEQISLLTLKHF